MGIMGANVPKAPALEQKCQDKKKKEKERKISSRHIIIEILISSSKWLL